MKTMRGLLWPLLAVLAGCYSYTVAPLESVPEGAAVRARLSAAEAERQAEVLGRESRVLHAAMVGEENGMVVLQVRSTTAADAGRLHQRLAISRSGLLEIELRRLDRLKTAGVITALGAGVLLAALQATEMRRSGTRRDPAEPNASRIPGPGFRILFPLRMIP